MKRQQSAALWFSLLIVIGLGSSLMLSQPSQANRGLTPMQNAGPAAADSAAKPASPVRLVFIHHSTGGYWLADDHGGLGKELMANNYYVSATNYDWGPGSIGNSTDIVDWPKWFTETNSSTILSALYAETGQHTSSSMGDFGPWSRLGSNPGGENQIIVFKSCYPNSALKGNPNDPPAATYSTNPADLNVGNAKAIYNTILKYFQSRPDKLFVVVTAPPLVEGATNATEAANARAFNNWLVNDWLNAYPYKNVAVFDFYNVLTSNNGNWDKNDVGAATGNHHRWINGTVQHTQTVQNNYAAYPDGGWDSHPSQAGDQKATSEFVPLLNVFYNRWKASQTNPNPTPIANPSPMNTVVVVPTPNPNMQRRAFLPLVRR